jgi:hypothetical protein
MPSQIGASRSAWVVVVSMWSVTEQLGLHTGTYPDNPPRGLFGFLLLIVVVMVIRSLSLLGGLAQQFLDDNLKLDTRVLSIRGMVSMLLGAVGYVIVESCLPA